MRRLIMLISVGWLPSVWGEFFKGRIDEVRVYNRDLSATEINADRNTAIATSAPSVFLIGNQAVASVPDSTPKAPRKPSKRKPP